MRARRCLPRLSAEEDSRDLQSSSSPLSPEAEEVKHSLSFWPKVLLPLAVAAAAGIAVPAASAHARSAPSASTQSTCSLNPSLPPGFREQKVRVSGIGING
jgi:hypothetical protein